MATVNDQLMKAISLQGEGRFEEATRLFNQILKTDPNNAAALYSLSVISLNGGNHASALLTSEHGKKVAPNFAPMRFVHGAALLAGGRKEEALKSYDEALEIDPNALDVLLNSGVLLRDLHRHHEALERFNRIVDGRVQRRVFPQSFLGPGCARFFFSDRRCWTASITFD